MNIDNKKILISKWILQYILRIHKPIIFYGPYFFGLIIDGALSKDIPKIYKSVGCLMACLILVTLCNYIKSYIVIKIKSNSVCDLKGKIINNALLNYSAENRQERGNYISKLQDVDNIISFLVNVLCSVPGFLLSFLIMLYLLYKISPKLTIIQIIFIPLNVIFAFVLGSKARKWEKDVISKRDIFFSYIYELLDGIEEISLLGIISNVISNYNERNAKYTGEVKNKEIKSLKWSQWYSLFQGFAQILLLFISCVEIAGDKISIGSYYTFNSYASRISNLLITLVSWQMQYNSMIISVDHIYNELSSRRKESIKHDETVHRIVGREITFSYGGKVILNNINFVFNQGEIYVITGENGSGKTTLLKIIANFLKATRGYIIVNDQIVNNNEKYRIAFFSANVFLFNTTIRDNLEMVNISCNMKEIKEACIKIGINQFIEKLPNGYMSKVGEKGEKISKGQMQSLAIARAFLIDADVYIFDEVTTYLDNDTERKFYSEIVNMSRKGKIIVLATHKIENIPPNAKKYKLIDGSLLSDVL